MSLSGPRKEPGVLPGRWEPLMASVRGEVWSLCHHRPCEEAGSLRRGLLPLSSGLLVARKGWGLLSVCSQESPRLDPTSQKAWPWERARTGTLVPRAAGGELAVGGAGPGTRAAPASRSDW